MDRSFGRAIATVVLIGCGATARGSTLVAPTPDNTGAERCLSSQYSQAAGAEPTLASGLRATSH